MFRGRLMFPIQDLQGRPIALGGRVIPAIAERHGERAGGDGQVAALPVVLERIARD